MYQKDLGAMATCAIRLREETTQVKDVVTVLIGYVWFDSIRAAATAAKRGYEAIYQIKSNHSLFPKQYIKDILKDTPSRTHIVLERQHPEETELIAIGY